MPSPLLIALIALPVAAAPNSAPAAGPSAERPKADVAKTCPNMGPRAAAILRKPVDPQRLIELPPGRLELTVLRVIGNCPIPAVLREGIGAR